MNNKMSYQIKDPCVLHLQARAFMFDDYYFLWPLFPTLGHVLHLNFPHNSPHRQNPILAYPPKKSLVLWAYILWFYITLCGPNWHQNGEIRTTTANRTAAWWITSQLSTNPDHGTSLMTFAFIWVWSRSECLKLHSSIAILLIWLCNPVTHIACVILYVNKGNQQVNPHRGLGCMWIFEENYVPLNVTYKYLVIYNRR